MAQLAESAVEYFAAPYRERRIRMPELGLWITCLEGARSDARQLARGIPLEKASGDIRRRRWQLTWDVANLWEWLSADDEGGLGYIVELLDSCMGRGAFDVPRFKREVTWCLECAGAHVEVMAKRVARDAMLRGNRAMWPQWRFRRLHLAIARGERSYQPTRQVLLPLRGLCREWDALDAGERAEAVRCPDVPGQVPGPKRVLRQAPGQGAQGLGNGRAKKQNTWVERKPVAEDPKADPREGRVHVPVRRVRRCG